MSNTGAPFPPAVARGDAFTAQSVRLLLNGQVLRSGKAPAARNHACSTLARILNVMERTVAGWQGPWRESATEGRKIAEAIETLATLLPRWRGVAVEEVQFAAWAAEAYPLLEGNTDYLNNARRNLAVFDALVEAAAVARDIELPRAPMEVLTPRGTCRTEFAEQLEQIFHSVVPDASLGDGYRFIAAVTPRISGETPSVDAVEQHLKRKRRDIGDIPPG